MTSHRRFTTAFALVTLFLAPAARAQHSAMPAGMTREQHMEQMKEEAEMKEHGNQAMGFDQDKTTHHFSVTAEGGAIAVDANEPGDQASRGQIRAHLEEIAVAFTQGDFQKPGAGHGAATPPDHMEHRFDNADEWAKSFDDPARDQWQMPSQVIAALDLKPGGSVADIGAGTGYFTMRLAKSPAAPKVFAVDIEKSMVEHVQQRAMHDGLTNIVAVLAAPDRTNLPEPVDVVLMVDTYHHIPNRVAYFTGLKARMKPGARLAIVDFRKGAPAGPPEEFRFTPDQISAELAKAGFALQATHDFLPRQMFLVYRVK